MAEDQRNARIFGVLFLITFITSIPALALYQPVLDDPAKFIAGDADVNQIYLGALLELLLIIANVGTALVVLPILRRQNEILAVGYVTARVMECVFIAAGVLFVLGIVSLQQDDPGAASLAVSLSALKDWTFLLGPGFIVGWGNGLILGYLMYSSGLVPRWMAMLGLIGGLSSSSRGSGSYSTGGTPAERCRLSRRSRSSCGSCRLASTRPSGDSGAMHRSSRRKDARSRTPSGPSQHARRRASAPAQIKVLCCASSRDIRAHSRIRPRSNFRTLAQGTHSSLIARNT
jgi:Domain of unknown function (DUF4386)